MEVSVIYKLFVGDDDALFVESGWLLAAGTAKYFLMSGFSARAFFFLSLWPIVVVMDKPLLSILVIGAAALLLLVFVLGNTSPLLMGPAGIMLVFGLIYICLFCFGVVTIRCLAGLAARFNVKIVFRSRLDYYLSSVLAIGPVLLLALNSIGQLDFKDFALIFIFITLGCFYVLKRT